MKPGLGFEGKVDEVWRNALQSALQLTLEARGEAGVVCGLHQDVTRVAVAGAGDSTLVARLAGGMLTDREPGERHEAWRIRKATEVADFGHDSDRGKKGDSTQRLEGEDEADAWALLCSALKVSLQSSNTLASGVHRNPIVIEHELAGRTLELQCVKPAVVARRPSLDPRRGLDRLSEQEFAQPVLGPAEIILGVKPDPHQVAQSFVLRTWNPNRREVSRA